MAKIKKNPRSDITELLSTELADYDAIYVNSHGSYARPLALAKEWYQRSVLLSGQNYVAVDSQNTSSRFKYGWRFGSLVSCIWVGAIFCFNVIFTICAVTTNPPNEDGIGKLANGACDRVLSTSTWVHVAINICSTTVVAASNYNMQCLTAPTRNEIDKVHKKGKHMEIGIQSIRNLVNIPKWKALLWLALLLSTLPLHLLWNSAIFSVTTINEYSGLVVTPEFLHTTDVGLDCGEEAMAGYQNIDVSTNSSSDVESYSTCWLLSEARAGKLTSVSPSECIQKYALKLETAGYNLIAVANSSRTLSSGSFPAKASQPVLAYFNSISYSESLESWCRGQCPSSWCEPWKGDNNTYSKDNDPCNSSYPDWENSIKENTTSWCATKGWDSSNTTFACYQFAVNGSNWKPSLQGASDWTCETDEIYNGGCNIDTALAKSSQWTILPEHYLIDYCLVSKATFQCELQYSSSILCAVIACNAIKFLAILLHLLFARDPIFATVGDAVASFLKEPDLATSHNCLFTVHDQKSDFYTPAKRWIGRGSWKPRIWRNDLTKGQSWSKAVSTTYLTIIPALWLICMILAGIYCSQGSELMASQSVLGSGFGAMNIGALVSVSTSRGGSNASVLATSIVVNTPQVIFSSLYFMYNAIYTCMTSAYEWSLFGLRRKALRVSVPEGQQRSSYWLQLPWRFSLPLIAASALLHWLISQSIFLVNVRIQTPANQLLAGPDQYFPMAGEGGVITAAGFSILAIVIAIAVGTLMLIVLIAICYLPLKPGITLVGSNSFAISAASHASFEDKNVETKPLLWGAVSHQDDLNPGHCCFSSFEVDQPRVGDMYA